MHKAMTADSLLLVVFRGKKDVEVVRVVVDVEEDGL